MLIRRSIFFSVCIFLLIALVSSNAWADGGFFIDTLASETQEEAAADGLLSSSGQRAVLWRTNETCWDLYVEPGTVNTADVAWVLPLPVNPDVAEASEAFIDQLDAATTPIFSTTREYLRMEYGGESDSFCGCAGDEAGAGDMTSVGTASEVEAQVTVWGQGRIGTLEYEVLTTETATALQDWLTLHQYVVPTELATTIEPYVADGYFFFVAKVSRQEADAANVSVARFTLCGDTNLWYPVRLSAYSIAGRLDFTLFVVDSSDIYGPTYCSWDTPGMFYDQYKSYWGQEEYDQHREEIEQSLGDLYDTRIDEILDAADGRSLALQYAGVIIPAQISTRIERLDAAGINPPMGFDGGDWTSEFRSIVDDNLLVTRFVGSFPPSAMEIDLEFVPASAMQPQYAVYERYIEIYDADPPGEDDGTGGGADAAGLLFIGGVVWLRRRARLDPT